MLKRFFPLFISRNICYGYLLESACWGDSNKYPQHMSLGVLNTVFLNISYYLPHLELKNRSIQIVLVTNFVLISNVGIKRFDCNTIYPHFLLNLGTFGVHLCWVIAALKFSRMPCWNVLGLLAEYSKYFGLGFMAYHDCYTSFKPSQSGLRAPRTKHRTTHMPKGLVCGISMTHTTNSERPTFCWKSLPTCKICFYERISLSIISITPYLVLCNRMLGVKILPGQSHSIIDTLSVSQLFLFVCLGLQFVHQNRKLGCNRSQYLLHQCSFLLWWESTAHYQTSRSLVQEQLVLIAQ